MKHEHDKHTTNENTENNETTQRTQRNYGACNLGIYDGRAIHPSINHVDYAMERVRIALERTKAAQRAIARQIQAIDAALKEVNSNKQRS